ncbi:hypothetical protein UFOVP184_4 [uncultured Caudovirales phage]|uniref:Uncharacterized protein n=1 Tax=uncultured Caudovirales phage TaxID=2100421 RepID=A0A6J7WD31_9CAUD|nr:hypothetical protein UFOVP184_4 [uncultured Caudovirales phage]
MPIPNQTMTLDLEKSPELLVYEAVIGRVTDDPVLSKVVQSWHHTPFNFAPVPIQKLPAIRIEAGAGGVSPETLTSDLNVVQIGFVLEVAQGYHGDLMNLWHAIRRCISSHNDDWMAMHLANRPNVVYRNMVWQQPAITYSPNPESRTLLSTAILSVSLAIRDC